MGSPGIKTCTDADFVELYETRGPMEVARILGVTKKNAFLRRRNLEKKLKRAINPPNKTEHGYEILSRFEEHPGRINLKITDGIVLVGSDAHYHPGVITTAHKALVKFCKDMKPAILVMNGDIIDGASISRHSPIGWEHRPSLIQEIEAASERLDELFTCTPQAKHIWPLGNHDARFSTRLATVAPEFAQIRGTQLKDHFPGWSPCWSVWINDVVIKHRFKSGIHAPHNNTMWAGKSMVTGHLHSLKVSPLSDYNGTRYGVDTGTLADPYGQQFNYVEDNPVNWRSGFVVLTFHKGRLLWPEVVNVCAENEVEFRGKVVRV